MYKRRSKLIVITLFLAIVVATTTSLAFMFSRSPQQSHHFDIANVSCKLNETFDGKAKTSVTVTNTSNIDAYGRVQFATHWEDEQHHIIGDFVSMPVFEYDDHWLKKENTYYYRIPISAQSQTIELLKTPIVLENKEVDGKTLHQVIDIFAEVIQSEPQEAVLTSWKVVLDGQGHIQDVQ